MHDPEQFRHAASDFWQFCQLLAPRFYLESRCYLRDLCWQLQAFLDSDRRVLVINMPPRHGKTRTAILLAQWILGRSPNQKIMAASYNEILSTSFARAVRNGISEKPFDPACPVFADVFPDVKLKRGEATARQWAIDGQFASFLATSPSGTATGFGATVLIVDDLIKTAAEAFNETALDKQWNWFTDTMLSRLETGYKIMIIMTRWASRDLAGRALSHWPDATLISMPAILPNGSMLCDALLSREDFEDKKRTISEEIVSANYLQQPVDLKGCLYSHFRTYDVLPCDANGHSLLAPVCAYIDTADTGSDFLCAIIYGVYHHEAYILDVYYTDAPMERTEPETARRLIENRCTVARIESNNGGRGFSRNIQRIMQENGSNRCRVEWFHQNSNKMARILTNATWIQDHILFPVDWRLRWPDYYAAMIKFQKNGRNTHDDAPDATSGVAEQLCCNTRAAVPLLHDSYPHISYWRR